MRARLHRTRLAARVASALAATLLAVGPAKAQDDMHQHLGEQAPLPAQPRVQQANGISYVSGGVGEEKEALERMSASFNLKLTMSTPDGKFKPAPLSIEDGSGRVLLEAPDAGPMFLAKLPAGNYRIHLRPADAAPVSRTVTVPSSGQAELTMVLADDSTSP